MFSKHVVVIVHDDGAMVCCGKKRFVLPWDYSLRAVDVFRFFFGNHKPLFAVRPMSNRIQQLLFIRLNVNWTYIFDRERRMSSVVRNRDWTRAVRAPYRRSIMYVHVVCIYSRLRSPAVLLSRSIIYFIFFFIVRY